MPYKCAEYRLCEKKMLTDGVYSFTIGCPDVAAIAKAGQFVHIKVDNHILRRPISICEIDADKGALRIVFEVRGAGTAELAETPEGGLLDMIAPLGNGFNLPHTLAADKKYIFIGGGIGVPPLLGAARWFGGSATAILGFRSIDKVILTDDFQKYGVNVITCTDDGSSGFKGLVTEPFTTEITKGDVEAVFACGPTPMLKAIVSICREHGIKSEVSLEQRMGCGVGSCAVCTCIVNRDSEEQYLRVCKDGPVFNGEDVIVP